MNKRLVIRVFSVGLSYLWPVALTLFSLQAVDAAVVAPILGYESRFHPVVARSSMVVAQEELAARVGLDVLKRGGNAVDAAVATALALAVTFPKAGNLAGGGFMLVYLKASGNVVALDFREAAPRAATRDMYLRNGKADPALSRFHALAVGVPGNVAGLWHAQEKWGSLPMKDVLAPAIALARDGFVVSAALAGDLKAVQADFATRPELARTFLRKDGTALSMGERLVQRDLAATLDLLARYGERTFYEGELAQKMVAHVRGQGGIMDMQDMANYSVEERAVLRGSYRSWDILAMPPPSSGGVHILQILNILEGYDLPRLGHNSATYLHILAEAMKRAYADRSCYLGDPDRTSIPLKGLLSKEYAGSLRVGISTMQATPSANIAPGRPQKYESDQTTHLSVVDVWGNAVSLTTTLNFSFGSRIVVPGTGILLNNEMDDFSASPGTPNAFGLVGGEANAIAPGKRPLSSMAPVFVFKDGQLLLVTGSPGGSQIITAILQLLINSLDFGMNVAEATACSRMHHQWLPDELLCESGISPDTIKLLSRMGHAVRASLGMGSTQSIMLREGMLEGAADPRRPGAVALGY